jgi:hypothetical protein
MKIKIVKKCFVDGNNAFAGDEIEVNDRIADKLIKRGYAEKAKAAKKKKGFNLSNRKVDETEIEVPEAE